MKTFGARTDLKDSDGIMLYEYDRVYVESDGQKYAATIINCRDFWNQEFFALIDKGYWKFDTKPMKVKLANGNCTLIKKSDYKSRLFRNEAAFINYCNKYDYHALALSAE